MMTLIKFLSAILPVMILMWLLYRKSRDTSITKKQKKWGFALGAISTIIIMVCISPLHFDNSFLYVLLKSALPEEFIKMVLMLALIKKYQYKSELDIILLCGTVGLGFACLENIIYILTETKWIVTAIIRATTSIPDHFVYAIIMGYFINKAIHLSSNNQQKTINIIVAFVIPVLIHWVFNCSKKDLFNDIFAEELIMLIGLTLPTILVICAFKYIKRLKSNTIICETLKTCQ